jgi:pyridoxine 5-phosphate synthase
LVTLVPESREEVTTEGGMDMIVHNKSIGETIGALQNNGIPVSIFIDPEPEQIKLVHQADANMIEIHTGTFCEATGNARRRQAFAKIVDAAKLAKNSNWVSMPVMACATIPSKPLRVVGNR